MESYEKKETLGQGQFGIVFKARDKKVGRTHTSLSSISSCKALLQQNPPILVQGVSLQTGGIVAIKKIRLGQAKEASLALISSSNRLLILQSKLYRSWALRTWAFHSVIRQPLHILWPSCSSLS